MAAETEPRTPSAVVVAQRLADRALRASALVAQFEAEKAAGMDPELRALRRFRWLPLQSDDEISASLLIVGASGRHAVRVSALRCEPADPERWVVEARCDCPDHWGHTWCGACKHELAARVLVARALASGCRPRPPAAGALVGVPAEQAEARADAVARHGVVFPFPSPADRPAA